MVQKKIPLDTESSNMNEPPKNMNNPREMWTNAIRKNA